MSLNIQRRSLTPFLAAVVFSFATSHSHAQVAPSWKQVKIPALHAFKPQQPKRIELPNGMVLMLQEDHELPIIDGFARIRGGSREEPAEKIGLVDTFGDAWRTGGTKTKTGDELDDFLEARAAKVETGAMLDSTNVSFSCLKADFDDVFAIFNDVLRNPEFRQEKIDLAKDNSGAEIARRNDNASGIAGREANKLGYGAQNPYARVAEFATIAAIKRQDLIDWHNTHVHPNNILLGIVGDFDSKALEAKLRAAFESWSKGPAAVGSKVDPQPAKPGYYLIEKKDVNQSNINMVELGTKRNNPDYYAITVFNEAFGGGFSSRLFSNIRSKKGLAYGVGGGVGASYDHDGLVHLSMGTKSATTVEALHALFEEVDALKTNPLSADEIRRAKDSILNSFIFNFDSPAKVLRERMAYEFYGYPFDYLERYRTGIEKVTPEDVARAATKYVHKDQFAVLVVGNTAEFDKPLSSLGPVSTVDITIPGAPSPDAQTEEQEKPIAASNLEGKALAAKVAEAMGGLEKLKSIHAIKMTISLVEKTPQGDVKTRLESTLVCPDTMHAEVETPGGKLTIVVSPDTGFVVVHGGVHDLPPAQKADTALQVKRDLICLAQHVDDPAYSFTAGGTEKVGATDTRIVDVAGPGVTIRWYVDPTSGRIVRETYQAMGQSGPFEGATNLSNWKTESGITLPATHANQQNGKDSSTAESLSAEFNPAIDPNLFQKPAGEVKPAQ